MAQQGDLEISGVDAEPVIEPRFSADLLARSGLANQKSLPSYLTAGRFRHAASSAAAMDATLTQAEWI
jgi:hypothetical protein